MADRGGYIGRNPGDSSVIVARQSFEPTGVQTDFTFSSGYTPGYIDVYLNGSRLIVASDYTAVDGSVVGLTTNAISGDVLELVAYKAFNVATIDSAPGDLTVGNDLTIRDGDLRSNAHFDFMTIGGSAQHINIGKLGMSASYSAANTAVDAMTTTEAAVFGGCLLYTSPSPRD